MLGPVPLPLVLLVGSIVVSGVLGLILLGLHAGWIGRRIGRRVAERVEPRWSDRRSTRPGFGGLERVEAARRTIGGMT